MKSVCKVMSGFRTAFDNYLQKNIFLELPGQFGNSRIIGFTKLSIVFGLEKFGRFCFPSFFNFPSVALF